MLTEPGNHLGRQKPWETGAHVRAGVSAAPDHARIPRNLNQAANEIRQTIMPFKPKLFDQWKSDIGGVEMGQVIFQFEKNGKLLFTHMVIIPLKEKLLYVEDAPNDWIR